MINALRKVHGKIIRRLHTSPNIASPWFGDFTMDLPKEVFGVIFQDIIERNGFGHESKQTPAVFEVTIFEMKKAVFVFKHINTVKDVIPRKWILKKQLEERDEESEEKCEVIVSASKPMKMKFNKNSEVLFRSFSYGYRNTFGVPQH